MSGKRVIHLLVVLGLALSVVYVGSGAAPAAVDKARAEHERIVAFWTPERVAKAMPRDLRVTPGNGAAPVTPRLRALPVPLAKPAPGGGGGSDITSPIISSMNPAMTYPLTTITATQEFSAIVTDEAGVKSVTFVIKYPLGNTQNFVAGKGAGDVWSLSIQGFTTGDWSWQVVAKDNAKRGGNTSTSLWVDFTCCSTGGGGGGGVDVVTNSHWTNGGSVQTASGRLLFEMPSNPKKNRWSAYVCSGTVAEDLTGGRSVIITAAHCVYDDAYKEFARNVMFIPDQDGTTGSGTDWNCNNDPLGCWTADFGVVDLDYTTTTFPSNNAWDYGFYVVTQSGTKLQSGDAGVLDEKAGSLGVSFDAPTDPYTHAFGYSYSADPNLMYCAEDLGAIGTANWWLPNCGMTGGSSGGPWMQSAGEGPIISVNSWGYTNQPGMAGPKLSGTSASCVFNAAKSQSTTSTGIAVICPVAP